MARKHSKLLLRQDVFTGANLTAAQWLRFGRRRIFANDRRVARRDLGQGIAPVARVSATASRLNETRSPFRTKRARAWRYRWWRKKPALSGAAFRHPDHGRPQHAVADHVAGLHHLHDAARRELTDRAPRIWPDADWDREFFPLRFEPAHAILFQRLLQLALGHPDAHR